MHTSPLVRRALPECTEQENHQTHSSNSGQNSIPFSPRSTLRRVGLLAIAYVMASLVSFRADAFPAEGGRPHPAVVRVVATQGKTISKGSGTLVGVRGEHGLIVTNWHVVREASDGVHIIFPDGFNSSATILAMDRNWDLAALLIWKPTVSPVSISLQAPKRGEVLTIAGYGSGTYRAVSGPVRQYVSPGRSFPFEMVEVGTQARQGDSGGPILNKRGELAGVLFGAGRGTTSGSYSGRVRSFLSTVWGEVPNDGTMIARNGQTASPKPAANSASRHTPRRPRTEVASNAGRSRANKASGRSSRLQRQPATSRSRDPSASRAAAGSVVSLTPRDPYAHNRPSLAARAASVEPIQQASSDSVGNQGISFSWDSIQWGQIVGTTWPQQIKSVLAIIGVLAMLVQFRKMSKE